MSCRKLISFAGIVLAGLSLPGSSPAGVFPGATWGQRSPGEAGLDVDKLDALANLVSGSGMIVRDGYQVYAWGNVTQSADWASASKPVMSTLLFVAAAAGSCDVHSTMGQYLVGGTAKDDAISFYHLANMISGYSRTEGAGQAWAYNDHAIQLYGYVLFEEVFGALPSTVYASELSFLQFQDPVDVSDSKYGRISGMSIRDFARIGLFWLNRGLWGGTQRVPAAYFDLVTNQVDPGLSRTAGDGPESWSFGTFGGGDNDNAVGPGHYGMNFWVNTNGLWPGQPADVYQANGHFGQEVCFVIPSMNVVAAGVGGSWGDPSTAALQLLIEADLAAPVTPTSFGSAKARFRSN